MEQAISSLYDIIKTMLGYFLKKIFKMNNDNKEKNKMEPVESKVDEQPKEASKQQAGQQPFKRQFELQVFDEDLNDDGTIKLKPVRYDQALIVEASSPKQLNDILMQYRACGQVAKVIREVTPPEVLKTMLAKQVEASNTSEINVSKPKQDVICETKSNVEKEEVAAVKKQPSKAKPKIVTIGDMQVKYDGEHVYQKQWVKLNVNEASNFRVVSDSSNKIVSLSGKHIEARRWILVEETKDDESSNDATESLILGN